MDFKLKLGTGGKSQTDIGLLFKIGNFWKKIYKYVFFVTLIVAVLLGLYIWQQSLSYGNWSAEKKLEYLSSQNKSVILREGDLKKVLADIESRKNQSADSQNELKDIFKEY